MCTAGPAARCSIRSCPRRGLRARGDGDARGRSGHPAEQAHLRRIEGALVHHHRRPAAVGRVLAARRRLPMNPAAVHSAPIVPTGRGAAACGDRSSCTSSSIIGSPTSRRCPGAPTPRVADARAERRRLVPGGQRRRDQPRGRVRARARRSRCTQVIGVSVPGADDLPAQPAAADVPGDPARARGAELLFWPVSRPAARRQRHAGAGAGLGRLGVPEPRQRRAAGAAASPSSASTGTPAARRASSPTAGSSPTTTPSRRARMFAVDRVAFGMPQRHAAVAAAALPRRAGLRAGAGAAGRAGAPLEAPAEDHGRRRTSNRCRLRIIGNALAGGRPAARSSWRGTHQTLSQPWTAAGRPGLRAVPAGGGRGACARHGGGGDAGDGCCGPATSRRPSGFLDPFAGVPAHPARRAPQEFAALAAEVDAMEIVPEDCRAALRAERTRTSAAFAPIVELLTEASDRVRQHRRRELTWPTFRHCSSSPPTHDFGLTAPLDPRAGAAAGRVLAAGDALLLGRAVPPGDARRHLRHGRGRRSPACRRRRRTTGGWRSSCAPGRRRRRSARSTRRSSTSPTARCRSRSPAQGRSSARWCGC